ncbi:MAG TPA: FHA domain-containing protein [Thermoanaerobaculia bacterium]|nr:FHA domain-containing protein [Thermoanaerobaculia bacterium]
MIECTSCHTLNPDAERACLMCGLALPAALGAATLRCPAGHPIDPSWKSCPYCDRQQGAGGPAPAARTTRLEATADFPGNSAGNPAGASRQTRLDGDAGATGVQSFRPAGPQATRLEATPPAAQRRTVLAEPPAERGGAAAPAGLGAPPVQPPVQAAVGRRLVGVLAAPGLGLGGAVFAVRQGKNLIGSDRASEVCLSADPRVSLEHALLLHRGSSFYLADRMSTNGTWVNDTELPANGTVVLRDRDRIRCGGVDLIFLIVERAEDLAEAPAD